MLICNSRRVPVPGNALPDKLFFKIGEVAQIVGVRAHVLRYWESEFAALRPLKTRGSHRVYRRRDVELVVLLRRLLHEEGLTIAGAKRRLRELGGGRAASELEREASAREQQEEPHDEALAVPARESASRAELVAVRDELRGLLCALDSVVKADPPPVGQLPTEVSAEGRARSGIMDRSGR